MKMDINYDELNTTAHEFDKRLLDEVNNDVFKRDDKGTIIGLDYLKFAEAASTLLLKITKELKEKK